MIATLKRITLVIGICLSVLLVACASKTELPEVFDNYKASPAITEANTAIDGTRDKLAETAAGMTGDTQAIRKNIGSIERILPEKLRHRVSGKTNNIRESADSIDAHAEAIEIEEANLVAVQEKLSSASAQITQMERYVGEFQEAAISALAERDAALKEAEKANQKAKDASRSALKWLILLCTVGGGAGIAVMVFGHFSIGGILTVSSGCILVFAIAVDQYFNYIAYGGVAIILLAIMYLVYMIVIRNRAVEEIVHTTEIAKQKLPPAKRKEIFGHKEDGGGAHNIQSKSTEYLVNSARQRFRASWTHTVPGVNDDMDKEFDEN